MPIRFRCVYCNQLLGISRRKAGTIVRCTSCEGQLIVPDPSDSATEAAQQKEPAPPAAPDEPLKTESGSRPDAPAAGGMFEDSEFDAFLEPLNVGKGGQAVASPPAPSARRSATGSGRSAAVSSVVPGPEAALMLSRRGLTVAIALAVLGIGLSFAGGLWLGMSLR
jgi:hypothetical protein